MPDEADRDDGMCVIVIYVGNLKMINVDQIELEYTHAIVRIFI